MTTFLLGCLVGATVATVAILLIARWMIRRQEDLAHLALMSKRFPSIE
jgi:hypothetical protein